MSDVICPQCGNDSLVGLVAQMTNTYRCDHCAAMVRFFIDKPKPAAREPHPDTMAGK